MDPENSEQEHARKEREAELERNRKQERGQHDRDLAMLAANRKVAVANAKVKAIELAMEEQAIEERREIPGIPHVKTEERTLNWVRSNPNSVTQSQPQKFETKYQPEIPKVKEEIRKLNLDHAKLVSEVSPPKNDISRPNFPTSKFPEFPRVNTAQHTPSRSFAASTPIKEISASHLIETLTSSNKQMVTGLARQNPPKCHPDTFTGDPTIFHPWKMAFKAMISEAVSPVNEINYLRSFTSGEPQRLVDNYRKRQQCDPSALLNNLWEELEKRFGSPASITNALLGRMHETAAFSDSENVKLQEFADLCADIESQIAYLPGLGCLNFPNAIQPVVEKLPPSLHGKWEKEIAKHYDNNAGAYPGFTVFSKVIQNHAKIKNNPNIHIGATLTPVPTVTPSRRPQNRRALTTNTRPPSNNLQLPSKGEETIVKRCLFHERDGHDLQECKAFSAKPLEERTEWIKDTRLCFRCFSPNHVASRCNTPVQCAICGDKRHSAVLHKEKRPPSKPENETVNPKCTVLCGPTGGVSCSKTLLVDVYSRRNPHLTKRVYAIIDEQSNSSLVTSELADDLRADGPLEKYFLSTCSGEKEEKYGRRVAGITVCSLSGAEFAVPTLTECDTIPQDKREISTPDMARSFPHLKAIAHEIPPVNESAKIHLLLGRDALELLKVREFRNGPKGAPWAQRLALGWTISGQMCLDFASGPAHVLTRLTSLSTVTENESETGSRIYELVPCPNQIKVTDPLLERATDDICRKTRGDNEPRLSCEDRKFLEIMDRGIHKNSRGNWEMPRVQAMQRLQGLLKTFARKPEMKADYLEFMGK